jgi:hypothetical protein
VTVDGPCRDLETAPSGWAYVACSPHDGATVHVLDLDGRPVPGWPVQVEGTIAFVSWWDFAIGCGAGLSAVEVGSDGSAYVAVSTGSVVGLHVFNPDGAIRAGWPQAIPGDAPGQDGHGGDGCRGFALTDDDGVVAWGYQDTLLEIQLSAGRTEFAAWSADGEMRSGWPRGSVGAASGPVLDADGGITYVSASGRVWSHDEAGEIRPGWPYVLDGTTPPYQARDGRVVLIDEVQDAPDRLIMLGRDGQPVTGGPIELPTDIESVCIFGDTPCAGIIAPAFADDGTMYLSLAWSTAQGAIPDSPNMGGALIAYEPDGSIVDGWPIDLAQRTHVLSLSVDVEDRLVARGYVCSVGSCGEGAVETTLIYASDGELIEQRPGE